MTLNALINSSFVLVSVALWALWLLFHNAILAILAVMTLFIVVFRVSAFLCPEDLPNFYKRSLDSDSKRGYCQD